MSRKITTCPEGVDGMGGPEGNDREISHFGPDAETEVVVDAGGRIVHWNGRAERLLGSGRSAVSGGAAAELFVTRDGGGGGAAGLPPSGTEAVLRSKGGAGVRCAVR